MASNRAFGSERFVSVAPTNPASPNPLSGAVFRYGKRVGVALEDFNTSTSLVAGDFGGIYNLSVKGENNSGNTAVTAGDNLYYVDGHTYLSKDNVAGYLAGQALAGVGSGATASIAVALYGVPGGAGLP